MSSSVKRWADREFADVALGDARLDKRFRSIVVDLGRRCGKTLASSFTAWSKTKAAYRFFANRRVESHAMLAPHIEQTAQRIRALEGQHVLLIQDTSDLDFGKRPKTKDLDLVGRHSSGTEIRGLMLHNTLATTLQGLPLGLVDQRFIDRKEAQAANADAARELRQRAGQPIGNKESSRWLDVIRDTRELDTGTACPVHVMDREADIYELFRDAAALGEHVLVRAAQNRAINKAHRHEEPSSWLYEDLSKRRAQGRVTVRVQTNGRKKFRKAKLSIITRKISMPPPSNRTVAKDGQNLPMIELNAIMAIERDPPNLQDALRWVLLTDLPVDDVESAIEKVRWYSKRWNVEVFHKILKSGCAAEKAQLSDAERLKKYVTVKSIVAWRLFWLARMREHDPDASCEGILDGTEWKLLYRKMNKTSEVPDTPPSVEQALIWIAKLGGYIGRPSDPPPGVISQWRGWQRLSDMIDDFHDICGQS